MTTRKPDPLAPAWSIRVWTYPRVWPPTDIYCELAAGLVVKYPYTEGALSKVLKLIMAESRNGQPLAKGKKGTALPVPVKRTRKPSKPAPELPQDQLDSMSKFLKKTGRI